MPIEFPIDPIPLAYLDTDGTLAANSDAKVPTQKAVKTYADALIAANDAMVFKGVIDCSSNPNYPAADRGHTYRVSVAGKIGGASGVNVEAGDLLLCLTDSTASGNHATVGTNWTIAQANLDGAVIGPSSVTDSRLARFDGTTGKLLKANDVNGIAFSEIVQAAALSVLGVTGNATADLAAIAAASDHQVLRRSGTVLAFGAINLAQANAVSGLLPYTNVAPMALSEVWVHTPGAGAGGQGSTDDKIRLYTVTQTNTGSAITLASSSTTGTTFTINETGWYWMQRADGNTGAAANFGISVNSNQRTTSVVTITIAHRMVVSGVPSGAIQPASVLLYLTANDVVRAHDHTPVCNFAVDNAFFRIIRVA